MKARIFEIKRFAVHDGPGIRTTVFFKGCPLKCVWCHNPEGIKFKEQIAYYGDKCINCGECVSLCIHNAHYIENGRHFFDREKCIGCGKCAEGCLGNSLTFYGKEIGLDELFSILTEDKDFYENSGGGVTLSGGECLLQADFCAEVLKMLKKNGIHTAIDTCGFVARDSLDKVIPYTDLFLYDLKAFDEDVHIKCTGKSNMLILENLKYIDACEKNIELRIPYVPNFNNNQIPEIAEFLSKLNNIKKVKILPYHSFAGTKYAALNMKNTLPEKLPSKDEIAIAEASLKKYNLNV